MNSQIFHICRGLVKSKGLSDTDATALFNDFEPIDLSKDTLNPNRYEMNYNIFNQTVQLSWDIDALISLGYQNPQCIKAYNPKGLANANVIELWKIQPSIDRVMQSRTNNMVYTHDVPFAIFVSCECLHRDGQYDVIDGNHKLAEAYLDNLSLPCFLVDKSVSLSFLFPHSQHFLVYLMKWAGEIDLTAYLGELM